MAVIIKDPIGEQTKAALQTELATPSTLIAVAEKRTQIDTAGTDIHLALNAAQQIAKADELIKNDPTKTPAAKVLARSKEFDKRGREFAKHIDSAVEKLNYAAEQARNELPSRKLLNEPVNVDTVLPLVAAGKLDIKQLAQSKSDTEKAIALKIAKDYPTLAGMAYEDVAALTDMFSDDILDTIKSLEADKRNIMASAEAFMRSVQRAVPRSLVQVLESKVYTPE